MCKLKKKIENRGPSVFNRHVGGVSKLAVADPHVCTCKHVYKQRLYDTFRDEPEQ